MFHPFRIFGLGEVRDHLVQDQLHPAPGFGVHRHPLRERVKVPRFACPLLTLSLIRWELHRMTIRPHEGLVSVEDGLNGVLSRRNQA